MRLYTKHVTLINNCYPDKDGEKGPRSSELSYLMFYASSRPVKLTKVGSFLESKVMRDIAKGRKQNNQVTLIILKALIQKCHRDLNLFSKYVVKILIAMLDTRDIDIMDVACETFIVFCSYHDGSTLGVDSEFTSDYEELIKRYAKFCVFTSDDETLTLQTNFIGHRAMQAVIISNALQSSNSKEQISIVLPPLMQTLSAANSPANELALGKESVDIRTSATNNSHLNKALIGTMAAQTTAHLFSCASGVGIRIALGRLFTFMNDERKWWPPTFAVSTMELILGALTKQYRYLLVSEVLQQLDHIKDDPDHHITDKHAALVSILDTILNADIPLIGISVLEVLHSLFSHLIKSLRYHSFRETQPSPDDIKGTYEYAVHQGLAHSIEGLATQTYYQNQLNDMTAYIIQKLRIGTKIQSVDDMPLDAYRHVALRCLSLIVLASKEQTEYRQDDAQSQMGQRLDNDISLDSWIPAIPLLHDKMIDTRVMFAKTLIGYLDATTESDITLEPFPKRTLHQHGDLMFINAVHKTIVEWVQIPDIDARDIHAIYGLLCVLTRRFDADGTVKTMPVIFKLQSLAHEDKAMAQDVQRYAVMGIVVEWLRMISHFHNISRVVDYIEGIYASQEPTSPYGQVYSETMDALLAVKLEDLFSTDQLRTVDRQLVVEAVVEDGPLRDENDVGGKDLESKLLADWDSDVSKGHDRSSRIRTSRNMDDLKPKLDTNWMNTEYNHSPRDKKTLIKVEHLRDALETSSPMASTSVSGDAELCSLRSVSTSQIPREPSSAQNEIDSLLKNLNLGTSSLHQSSTSLLHPPYA